MIPFKLHGGKNAPRREASEKRPDVDDRDALWLLNKGAEVRKTRDGGAQLNSSY